MQLFGDDRFVDVLIHIVQEDVLIFRHSLTEQNKYNTEYTVLYSKSNKIDMVYDFTLQYTCVFISLS